MRGAFLALANQGYMAVDTVVLRLRVRRLRRSLGLQRRYDGARTVVVGAGCRRGAGRVD